MANFKDKQLLEMLREEGDPETRGNLQTSFKNDSLKKDSLLSLFLVGPFIVKEPLVNVRQSDSDSICFYFRGAF